MTFKSSWGNLTMWPPFLHHSKKPSSSLQFGQKENIPGHSIERRAYWFILKIGRMFLILRSRNNYQHMQEIVYRISLCFSIPKRPSFSLQFGQGTHLKVKLTNLFWQLPGYSLFPHRQSRQECEHFANG